MCKWLVPSILLATTALSSFLLTQAVAHLADHRSLFPKAPLQAVSLCSFAIFISATSRHPESSNHILPHLNPKILTHLQVPDRHRAARRGGPPPLQGVHHRGRVLRGHG